MKISKFNRCEPWAEQLEIARSCIASLRSSPIEQALTEDYASSLALASLLVNLDKENLVQTIEVYTYHVRIVRNDKSLLSFSAVIVDYVQNRKVFQDV